MIEVNRLTLPNGLRLVHNYDASTAMVAVNVLYDVGARDEDPELTGLAHLFEHLMFGGSVNVPDFDAALQRAGGQSNAWTSNDFTNFYDIVPAHNAETAFWIESDRMLSLSFEPRSLEVQRSVVIEEFKQQCLNRPYGDQSHHLRRMVYTQHPYRWPVIGKDFTHIERVSLDDVRRFFFSHYSPANAVLSVCGNITFERAAALATKWFGTIDPRPTTPRCHPAEPRQTSARTAVVSADVPYTDITIAYRMDGYGTTQYYAADLLTDLLAAGPSSLFYRRLLVDTDMYISAEASILGCEEPGVLMLNMRLRDRGDDAERRAIAAMQAVVTDLVDSDIDPADITRAINRQESALTFGNISYLNKARQLALCEIHRSDINAMLDPYRALTADDLRRAARDIFNPDASSTLYYRPRV